jgi:hypothetical protein|tara:strand:+ start:338 stop:520 length:183 start_codon:yes stop_codon:yes gene_type:complete
MSNIWVEWNSHQDKKNLLIEADSTYIQRRFFDIPADAHKFAAQMNKQGYFAEIKRDGELN